MRNIIKQVLKEEVDSKSDRVKSIVNKYGIERALEIIAGGVDTIKQAYQDNPESYLNQFNDLIPVEKHDKILYVDKDRLPLFYYYLDDNNGYVYINYERIWMFFYNVFEFETPEIKDILKNWLEETYNIRGLKPAEVLTVSLNPVGRDI